MKQDLFDRLQAVRAAKRPAVLVTELGSGRQCLLQDDGAAGELAPSADILAAARQALREDRSITVQGMFLQVFNPPLRLVLIGAVHIAQALAPMAALLGHAVTVVDPRRAFLTAERLPGVALVGDWPDEAMAALGPDARTAVVTLSHDPKIDDPALLAALRSPAYYVGALGSRKTHARRLERLAAAGLSEAETARIHAPVGLDIGATSPAEIALSVLAQMTATRHGMDAR